MARLMKISELVFEPTLYPRMTTNWITAYEYAQAMRAGAAFPPILVGSIDGKNYVVDGWHRCEAKRQLKDEYVSADIKRYSDFKEMFLDAVNLNVNHGRPLSMQEKVMIIDKLKDMRFTIEKISEIVRIPLDKISRFEARTVINAMTGEKVYLKAPMEEVLRTNPEAFHELNARINVDEIQKPFAAVTQNQIMIQFLHLLETDGVLFDTKDTIITGKKILKLLRSQLKNAKIVKKEKKSKIEQKEESWIDSLTKKFKKE